MITPTIYQISEYYPPQFIIDMIKESCPNFQYEHIKEKTMNNFIEENYLDEFPNFFNIFTSIQNIDHKLEIFKYYKLYIKGGIFLSSKVKLIKNLANISTDCQFFAVESIINKKRVFNGLIGSTPNNLILKTAIIKFCENINLLNENKYNLNEVLYSIIIEHKSQSNNIILFKEKINNQFSAIIDENDDVISIHYYRSSLCFIESNNQIIKENIKFKNKKDIKIGVTFINPQNTNKMFANGIHQNTLYFCELLLNIGYDTYLIINDRKNIDESVLDKIFYDSRFKVIYLTDILKTNLDFLVLLSSDISISLLNYMKYLKTKIIAYFCGNSYIVDTEKILYNQYKGEDNFNYHEKPIYDAIWSIPQMINTNKYYWETIYRCQCIEVPFIWSYKFSQYVNNKNHEYMYKKRDTKNIAIFEPNISIMKWCLPALFVCENSYRITKNISKVYLTNFIKTDKNKIDFDEKRFNKLAKGLELFKDKKLSVEARYNSLYFMSKYADIAVSHQWENPLNYLYLDLAWHGWPIVHNAHLCKDVGYYYEHFNYKQGGEILQEVILNHDNNYEEYLKKNRQVISRYLPSNEKIQNIYIELFNNL